MGDKDRELVLYPSQAARDEVVEKYGALEGGKQHLRRE